MIKRFLLFVVLVLIIGLVVVYFIPMENVTRYKLIAGLSLPLVLIIGGSIWLFLSRLMIRMIVLLIALAIIAAIVYYYVL